jgi:hypothetical protein
MCPAIAALEYAHQREHPGPDKRGEHRAPPRVFGVFPFD